MNNYTRFFCILFLYITFAFNAHAGDSENDKPQLLIIDSYAPTNERSNKIITTFSAQLNALCECDIIIEHMNCEQSPYFVTWTKWMSQLFNAYLKKPDLIVILGNEAWTAYSENCIYEWKDIPTILGNVHKYSVDFLTFNDAQNFDPMKRISITNTLQNFNVTGYYLYDYEIDNVKLIQTLQPEINTLFYLDDNRYKFKFSEFIIDATTQKCGLELEYMDGQKLTTSDVVEIFRHTDIRAAFLIKSWQSDASLSPHASTILHNEVRYAGAQVMYSIQESNMQNEENIGGYYVSCQNIGKDLAHLVYQALDEGIGQCPLMGVTPSKPQIYLNYNALRRSGINMNRVPADAVIVNGPASAFQTYKSEFVVILLFIICMFIVLLVLLINHKKNASAYQSINKQTRKILYTLPISSLIINTKYVVQDIVLPQNCPIFASLELSKVFGKNIKSILMEIPDFQEIGKAIKEVVRHTIISHAPQNSTYVIPFGGKNYNMQIKTVMLDHNQLICFFFDNTDVMCARKYLQQSHLFLQGFIDVLPLGIGVRSINDKYRYVFFNKNYKEYYHCPDIEEGKNDEEAGNPLAQEIHSEDLVLLKQQQPSEHYRTLHDKDKQPVAWLHSTKVRINGIEDHDYIIDICSNMTKQHQKDSAFIRMQQELNIAFESKILFVWSYNVEKKVFSSLNNMIPGQEISIDETMALINKNDHPKFRDMLDGMLNGATESICSNLRIVEQNSQKERWYEIHAYSIKDSRGKLQRIVGIGHDVTQEMQREKELENKTTQLELAMKASGYFEWIYNTQTQCFSSNDTQSIFYNNVPTQDLDKHIHPDDVENFKSKLNEIVEGKAMTVYGMLRGKNDNAPRHYEYIICSQERDIDSEEVISIIGLLKDVTEQHDKIEKLEYMRNCSEEANKMKSAFLANMSHEIRTPVNAIVGFSNLIAECDDVETRREYYNIIQTNNDLLLQLISDILDLSKIEAGQLSFSYSDFNLNELFTELEQIYVHNIKQNLSFACKVPLSKYVINSDKKRVTQVLSNFLSNANKYTFEGNIELGFTVSDSEIRCYVKDTGEGIAKANHEKVFGRFNKFNKAIQGSGLGLSICKNIIEHLNGTIGFESEEGQGSTFWFSFPTNIIVSVTDESSETTENANRTPMVLLATHSNSLHTLISCILKRNYSLIYAPDGLIALDLFAKHSPDVVLMDVLMPELNGFDTTKRIREKDAYVPIIGLTESVFDENNERLIQAGCSSTLTKPIKSSDLLMILDNIIKKTSLIK